MNVKKKIKVPSEAVYVASCVLLALAVAMLTAADFGVSMIVAPAYILHLKLGFLTFGQAEYVIQALFFVALCVVLKKLKPVFLFSFFTCLFYGAVLDLWRLIPFFNTSVTPPESIPIAARIALFAAGLVLTSFSVALVFKTYLYPQVYDFFVKSVSSKFGIKLSKFKTCFDLSMLLAATAMTLLFFGEFRGIWFGTLVIALVNGTIIGAFCKMFDKHFESVPLFPKFAALFAVDAKKTADAQSGAAPDAD